MRDFVYYRPASLDEARRLALEGGAMLLAGGQTLLRDMKHSRHSPASLIDITSVVPSRIELHDDAITIGAGATHAEVARSVVLRERLPVLADLVGHIGDPAVRHRGTLGGALAANEPAGDYPAAGLALGATVHTTKREVAATEFFVGHCLTVLEPGEIIIDVTFPLAPQSAYVKFLNPASRYAYGRRIRRSRAGWEPPNSSHRRACGRRVPVAGGGDGPERCVRRREAARCPSVARGPRGRSVRGCEVPGTPFGSAG